MDREIEEIKKILMDKSIRKGNAISPTLATYALYNAGYRKQEGTCKWRYNKEWDRWDTSCGQDYLYKDNCCPHCGKPIEIVEDEDE